MSSTASSPPSYSSGPVKNSVAERSVRMRWPVPVTWRMALSTCVPKDCPPLYRLNSGGKTFAGSAAEMNSAFCSERGQNHFAKLLRRRMTLRNLHVVLRAAGLMPGSDAAVHPFGLVENPPRVQNLVGGQVGRGSCKIMLRSLEFELDADQRGTAGTEDDVRRDATRRSSSGWRCC